MILLEEEIENKTVRLSPDGRAEADRNEVYFILGSESLGIFPIAVELIARHRSLYLRDHTIGLDE